MDRRLFLTGLIGIAGVAAATGATREARAVVAVSRNGILDELDAPQFDGLPDAEVEQIRHHRRHRRRRVWERVCYRYRRHGRWRTRCERRRVWRWVWV